MKRNVSIKRKRTKNPAAQDSSPDFQNHAAWFYPAGSSGTAGWRNY